LIVCVTGVLIFTLLFCLTPKLNDVLEVQLLYDINKWLIIIGLSLFPVALIEIMKVTKIYF
jgi:hypothetical protein